MKIKFTDPNTFVESELEFDDMQVGIAELLNDATKGIFKVTNYFPLSNNNKSLVFGILEEREPGEAPLKKFRIIIEKVE